MAGALLGLLLQMLVAIVLGLMMPGTSFSDGVTMSAISSMVATPACFAVAFSLMFSPRTRQVGVGLLIGAIVGTLLLAGGCAAFG
ncbi:hypothetical protein Afil01_46870 [Actinorhabdospora filicis]|uniref:Uncharacterized protein n=1 Tax=Actinorhabdospora filicis TaxID=1785913 RepID=A0A9W6WCK5_9ACTN|nr:hypothetical protein Afil01_46870 [Actinorhabdospora filicis]